MNNKKMEDYLYVQFCANDLIFKKMHLKQCILYRDALKIIISNFNLPEKIIEKNILNYVGYNQYPMIKKYCY